MERQNLKKELIGISFEEYQRFRKESRPPVANFILDKLPESKLVDNLKLRIDYWKETVTDYSTIQTQIEEFWKEVYEIIESEAVELITAINLIFIDLIRISSEANFSKKKLSDIYRTFEVYLMNRIYGILDTDSESYFAINVEDVITCYKYHVKFLEEFGLGLSYDELKNISDLYKMFTVQFETLKINSPTTFISFIDYVIKPVYKKTSKDYRIKYRTFYLSKCLEQIIVKKNNGLYSDFQTSLEDYYSEKLSSKTKLNWLFKHLIGYGENPTGLLFLFLGVNLIFSFIFTIGVFDFHFPEVNVTQLSVGTFTTYTSQKMDLTFWEKFINFLFFNNTTMLTVGYGEIYPVGIGAKTMVLVLQILGFTISGSAIALILKRILRF